MPRTKHFCLLIATFPMLAFAGKPEGIAAFEARKYQSAIQELTPAAQEGDAEAQYYLGRSLKILNALRNGRKRPNELDPEQQQAHGWFEKAVKQGYVPAFAEYAENLDTGFGTPVKYTEALDWAKKGAEANDNLAIFLFGMWYRKGHIVAPDQAKIDEYSAKLRANSPRSAEQEKIEQGMRDFAAQMKRTQKNIDPDRIARDLREAKAGDAEAARRVADEASIPGLDDKQDCAEAARWYERAGDLGDTYSYLKLGEQYYHGQCQQQDFGRARAFLLKASDENAVKAGYTAASLDKLANLEMFGQGQAIDYRSAYLHLKMLEMFSPNWTEYDPGRLNFVRRQLTPEIAAEIDQRATALATPKVERWKQERAEADAKRGERNADREALIRKLSGKEAAPVSN